MKSLAEVSAAKIGRAPSVLNPVFLSSATLVSRDLANARRLYEDVFGLECASPRPGILYARHPAFRNQPNWVLEVREVASIERPQNMMNHWGLALGSAAEVDQAYERIMEIKDKYPIHRVQKPRTNHGSHSFYLVDADMNWWEFEYRPPEHSYPAVAMRGFAPYRSSSTTT